MNKIPVILESDDGQSGAICLAMVLGYYGSFPKLNLVKSACGVSDDEILPENLTKAASRFGFTTKDNTGDFEEIPVPLPIIIKTTSGKYALITKNNNNNYNIHDTEKGEQKISSQNLKNIYDGWSLKLTPGSDFKVLEKQGSFYKELIKRVLPNFKRLIYVFIAGIILLIPGIVVPSFNKLFF